MSIRTAARFNNVRRSFVREILKMTERPDMISFAGGLPNPQLIPVDAIANATRKVLSENGREVLQYATSEGYGPLRQWIADRYRAAGVSTSADCIMIVNGSQQGLDLLGKLLLDKGDHVIVEEPTYVAAIQAFGLYEPIFHSIPMDDDGMDTSQLAQTLSSNDAKLIYCMPNFQNPSGVSYSEERRSRVAELARNSSAVLIEDDPYRELRFGGQPRSSLAQHLPERTVMLGSFSKTIAPGMRLGWICVPPALMDKLVVAKQAADLHSNYLSQRIIHQFLIDNDYEAHLARLRTSYGEQCTAMIRAIETHFPEDVKFTRPEGGMFLWITLPPGLSAMKLFELAIERNVCFVPGSAFHANGGGENTLRLNFSNSNAERIENGIGRLAEAIRELTANPATIAHVGAG